MCHVDWELLLEYLKVLLSAPPLATIAFLVFIFVFKKDIQTLLVRVKKIFNTELEPVQIPISEISEEKSTNINKDTNDSVQEIIQSDSDATYDNSHIKPLTREDTHRAFNLPMSDVVENENILKALEYEKVFNQIFGTQLHLLNYLDHYDVAIGDFLIGQYYQTYKSNVPRSNYSQTDYVNFLISSDLLKYQNNGPGASYIITPKGKNFMAYIREHYPIQWQNRPF